MSLASETAPETVRVPAVPLLFVLLLAAWWPSHAAYRSDDLLAVHYASDFWGSFADFAGPQYGLEGVAEFWRPLVTMSFAIEGLFGFDPFISHLLNTVVHAASTLLVAWLGVRFFGPFRGFMAALLWGLAPTHIGTIFWAVGRVDVFSTFFVLLTLVLMVRRVDGKGRGRMTWPILTCAFALMTKESAVVAPLAASLVAFAAARPGERFKTASRTWPLWILLVGYFGLRYLLFGGMGGYTAGETTEELERQIDAGEIFGTTIWPSIEGLSRGFLAVLAPIQKLPFATQWAVGLAFLPFLLALTLYFSARRRLLFPLCVVGFLAASAPMVHVWRGADEFDNLRLFYLPSISIALFLGGAGVVPAILTLTAWVLPFVSWHRDHFEQWKDSNAIHREMRDLASIDSDGLLFVAGLPRKHDNDNAIAFAHGVDRICQPPLVAENAAARIFALRPLDTHPTAFRIPYGEERGLPFSAGTDVVLTPTEERSALSDARNESFFGSTDAIERRFVHQLLPDPEIPNLELRLEGGDRIETSRLEHLFKNDPSELWIRCIGRRAEFARVTMFTGDGYLTVYVRDRAESGTDGVLHVIEWLVGSRREGLTGARANEISPFWAIEGPIALDLAPDFPLLIELGHFVTDSDEKPRFVVEAANKEPLWLSFEREKFWRFSHRRSD
ncbi:MAG: hypothetical protein AAF196_19060 [Planctomycetota bacterium]